MTLNRVDIRFFGIPTLNVDLRPIRKEKDLKITVLPPLKKP